MSVSAMFINLQDYNERRFDKCDKILSNNMKVKKILNKKDASRKNIVNEISYFTENVNKTPPSTLLVMILLDTTGRIISEDNQMMNFNYDILWRFSTSSCRFLQHTEQVFVLFMPELGKLLNLNVDWSMENTIVVQVKTDKPDTFISEIFEEKLFFKNSKKLNPMIESNDKHRGSYYEAQLLNFKSTLFPIWQQHLSVEIFRNSSKEKITEPSKITGSWFGSWFGFNGSENDLKVALMILNSEYSCSSSYDDLNPQDVFSDGKLMKKMLMVSGYNDVVILQNIHDIETSVRTFFDEYKNSNFECHVHYIGYAADISSKDEGETQVDVGKAHTGGSLMGCSGQPFAIQDLKLELLKCNPQKLTLTLDCYSSRNISQRPFVTYLFAAAGAVAAAPLFAVATSAAAGAAAVFAGATAGATAGDAASRVFANVFADGAGGAAAPDTGGHTDLKRLDQEKIAVIYGLYNAGDAETLTQALYKIHLEEGGAKPILEIVRILLTKEK